MFPYTFVFFLTIIIVIVIIITIVNVFIVIFNIIAFSRNERNLPNFVSQAREIEIFCEDCKLAAPPVFFQGF